MLSPLLASRSYTALGLQVGFEEFVQATIEAESSEHTSLADEQYMSQFGGVSFHVLSSIQPPSHLFTGFQEIYHFLANIRREKLIQKYEAESSRDDSLWEFLQFQRLAQISQAAVMPFAMTMPAKDVVDTRARNQLKRGEPCANPGDKCCGKPCGISCGTACGKPCENKRDKSRAKPQEQYIDSKPQGFSAPVIAR